jgi:hypothetical protein
MKKVGGRYLFIPVLVLALVLGSIVGSNAPVASAPDPVTTQVAIILDGSTSISSANWNITRNGLAAAVENSTCVPQDGSVELTVVQFSNNATLEVGPVVITAANATAVANSIRNITQLTGGTCICCGICRAADTLRNSTNFDADIKQALNLVTDGDPTRCCNCSCNNSQQRSATNSSGNFTNPAGAYNDTGNTANATDGNVEQYYGYNFNVTDRVCGIEVRLDAWRRSSGSHRSYSGAIAVELSWDGGTNWTSTGYGTGNLTEDEATYNVGGASDDWGRNWTASEVNNSTGLRVRLTAAASCSGSSCGTPRVYLDWVPVTVYYGDLTCGYTGFDSGCDAQASAECAREYALNLLEMTEDQDEFDAEGINITTANRDWLRDNIVWPEPGYDTWPPPGPGWVRAVANFTAFANTICEKFGQIMVPCNATAPDFSICANTTLDEQLFRDNGANCTGSACCNMTLDYGGVNNTIAGNYTYNVTCSCDGGPAPDTAAGNVTVNPLPGCDITAPAAVCENSVNNTASTTAVGDSYGWSLSAGSITGGQNSSLINWTAPDSGSSPVTISLTVTKGTCNASCSENVTIDETPGCDITAPAAVCENTTGLSANTTSGYATYNWSITNGTITSGTTFYNITWDAGDSSPVTLNVTVTNATCTATCSKVVNVDETPDCNITAADAVCENTTGLSANTTSGYASYNWSITNGTITSGTTFYNITWDAGDSSPVTLNVTVTDGACTASCSKDVTVVAPCNATAQDFSICVNTTLNEQLFKDNGANCTGPVCCNMTLDWSGVDNTTAGNYTYNVTCNCSDGICPAEIAKGNLTVVCCCSIGDTVFYDLNDNGVYDPSDPPIPGVQVTVYLDDGNGEFNPTGGTDVVVCSLVTNDDGKYVCGNISCTHIYWVLVDKSTLPPGFTLTTSGNPYGPIVLDPNGEDYHLADFGYTKAPLPPPMVPAVNQWGIAAMVALFAGLLVRTVRRRRLAS